MHGMISKIISKHEVHNLYLWDVEWWLGIMVCKFGRCCRVKLWWSFTECISVSSGGLDMVRQWSPWSSDGMVHENCILVFKVFIVGVPRCIFSGGVGPMGEASNVWLLLHPVCQIRVNTLCFWRLSKLWTTYAESVPRSQPLLHVIYIIFWSFLAGGRKVWVDPLLCEQYGACQHQCTLVSIWIHQSRR